MTGFLKRTALAVACAVGAQPAAAHVIAGARVFPVTLTFDDPGVSDEASLPALSYMRGAANGGTGPTHDVDLGFEYDKTITDTTALIFNDGWDIDQTNGAKTETGWENLVITGKWQAYTDADHEFVTSLGIQREMGATGTGHTGDDRFGSTLPTVYFGKGFGDMTIGDFRPFAVTGELSYAFADKELKIIQPPIGLGTSPVGSGIAPYFNNGNNNAWAGALSLQYSIPYLQSQVRNIGLTGWLAQVVPLVEFTWSSPASRPETTPTTWTAAPGFIYMAQWGEIGVEALVPLDRAAGTNVGAVALVHFFFDDWFADNPIGKPLLP